MKNIVYTSMTCTCKKIFWLNNLLTVSVKFDNFSTISRKFPFNSPQLLHDFSTLLHDFSTISPQLLHNFSATSLYNISTTSPQFLHEFSTISPRFLYPFCTISPQQCKHLNDARLWTERKRNANKMPGTDDVDQRYAAEWHRVRRVAAAQFEHSSTT